MKPRTDPQTTFTVKAFDDNEPVTRLENDDVLEHTSHLEKREKKISFSFI
jgi:hypothetical protein